eukprot:PhM_4_TR6987/c0_g1_i1/m.69265
MHGPRASNFVRYCFFADGISARRDDGDDDGSNGSDVAIITSSLSTAAVLVFVVCNGAVGSEKADFGAIVYTTAAHNKTTTAHAKIFPATDEVPVLVVDVDVGSSEAIFSEAPLFVKLAFFYRSIKYRN